MRTVYPRPGETLRDLAVALLALARPGERIDLDTGGLRFGFLVPDRLADAYEHGSEPPGCDPEPHDDAAARRTKRR